MRLIDADALKNDFDCVGFNDYDDYNRALRLIDNASTVINDVEYQAYCKGLEDGKKIAKSSGE